MTPAQALAFVERHGVVCEAARSGRLRSLVDAIAGEAVRGNWWSHPQSRRIFALTRGVRAEPAVLVCRLAAGKITFVHQRLWPGLLAGASCVPRARLARIHEMHTRGGKHIVEETPFPEWVPARLLAAASRRRFGRDENAELAALLEIGPAPVAG